ncbi:MAG: ATP-binding cassette domain-containing protein [SAR324 cluster bacterium]|uniref:ATP-binding cassette domain-containing protein n=1 Tax=SAR324 cluster bacterium TaxID=2024889 RepID=A0A7X9FPQ6_9DELT|nr:ATP-binding cassette domain-containing protein [SAR324 cluster bacterium]
MLKVQGICRSFGERRVLNDVSFNIPEEKLVGLIGPSGGGKSVLLKILGGVLNPDSGFIDKLVRDSMQVSLMFQEGALFDSLNVVDNVAFPLVRGKVPSCNLPSGIKEQVLEQVQEVLARVGLTKAAQKMPGQLSGGMRRRLSLARALVTKPKLLLLDDPTAGLDPVASSVIMDFIVELHREYRPTALLVSHDLRRLLPVVDSILGLFDGTIRFNGDFNALKKCDCEELRRFVSCRYDLT